MFNNYNEYKKNRKNMDIIHLPDEDNNINKCSIAIIIPHRNRIDHLIKFKSHMESMNKYLGENKMDIYVIDQNNADKFNRGLLLNLGYLISKKNYSYDRFIFHDVDSYPDEDIFKLYFKYLDYNIHFASPYLGYKYNFYTFFGGVIGFSKKDFEKINGFPNTFFGWGGEDDALYNRCVKYDIKVYRPKKGSYILIDHNQPTIIETNNKKQQNIINDLKNDSNDGVKQLLNFFINIKKYEYNYFIETYSKIDRNYSNNSDSIQTFIDKYNKFNIYKIDYLALHSYNYDKLLDKNYVNKKITEKLEHYKGTKYYQHPKHKEIISYIEPLIYIDEINDKIFNTYTDIKKFKIIKPELKKEKKIFNILNTFFNQYGKRTKEDLFNTIKFIFETYNELLYFRIRNNKLECAYHLYNLENKIDFLKDVKYKNQKLDKVLVELMNTRGKEYYTLRHPHNLPVNNCLLGFDSYNYFEGIPESYIKEFTEMLEYTIEHFKDVPDCDILINRKDFAYLRKDNKYAYEHLINKDITDINKFYYLGTQSVKDVHLDIPIPSADEWADITKYKNISNVKWEDKKNIAFFRGGSTGCGTTIETNQRLKISDISYKWKIEKPNLLDAALSKLVSRLKVYKQFIGVDNKKQYKYLVGSFVNLEDQLKYKYIFNIQGNAQAYRYSNEFKKKSVILNVESDYKMWFESILEDNKHIINIKGDFSDLYEKLKYLRDNDDKAKEIAYNGYKFSNRYINKKMIATYWLYYMYHINQNIENLKV